jgi:hypothetical protein
MGAGNHPVAAVEPERHLQRRGRLHPGQRQSHVGTDGCGRRDHATPDPCAALGPLAAASRLRTAPPDELTGGDVGAWTLAGGLSGLVGWLSGTLLTGMLAVIVGRAVFGSTIGAGETWARIRGRLPALIGLVALECAGLILLCGVVGVIVGAIAAAGNVAAAIVLGFAAGAGGDRGGDLPVHGAVVRTGADRAGAAAGDRCDDSIICLVRNSFWRVLGIRC